MPSIRDIKRRMKSVQNTGKITKAMEAVAATKMRKAQAAALAARPYAQKALEILERLSGKGAVAPGGTGGHWLLEGRTIERMALVLVTSDKGLCGVLNHKALGRFGEFARAHEKFLRGGKCDFVTVGNYGARQLKRRGWHAAKEFVGIGDVARLEESRPVSDFVLEGYRAGTYDQIFAIYTDFVSTLKQAAVLRQVLPLTKESLEEIASGIAQKNPRGPIPRRSSGQGFKIQDSRFFYEYAFEPSPEQVLDVLLPALVRVRIHQVILESNASEHSARMVAMKNASENAAELLEALRLSFNKARQAGITREIAEISAGAAALES